ncbi:hypothetical protein [Saccharothrix deserti]|uniref:hypothetical protein n=1 Tax=Saccharothrix deserti TaxID=2593674 RepID=UPI00192E5FB1|nr:hypothetical protein [Saccharothrix deserti]
MGRWRRVLTALAVVGLVVVGAPMTAQAVDCAGVTVVVDFRSLGGGVQTGCAPGDPSSGTTALTAAGFGYTFASRQPGFVCRINDKPSSDPCVNPSPPTAYWAYWHGRPGASWVYSDTSASAYDPVPGSAEGWSFGGGEQPGVAPPSSETAPSSGASSSSSATPTSTTSVAVEPTAGTSSGGAVGLVVGIVVIIALAGLGVWTARRRAKAAE